MSMEPVKRKARKKLMAQQANIDDPTEIITMAEVAELFDVSKSQVQKWMTKGVLTSHTNSTTGKRHMLRREVVEEARRQRLAMDGRKELTDKNLSLTSEYNKAKAVKETFGAKTARLNYEILIKELIKVRVVEKKIFELASEVRDAVLSIPDKISPELASMIDEREINIFLDKILRDCLRSISAENTKEFVDKNFKALVG